MTTSPTRSGLDLQWVDDSIRPQDDLFGHVNGRWLATHEIPDDRASDGPFRTLHDQAQEQVREIVAEAAEEDGPAAQRVADLFESFMDVERIEKLGTQPMKPILSDIADAVDKQALAMLLGRSERQGQVALVGAYVGPDSKDSSRYLLHLHQSGLGLPDESYYRDDTNAEVRAAYVAHLERLALLFDLPSPQRLAQDAMDLETAIAEVSWDRVTNRDPEKTYNSMTSTQLRELAPQFPWDVWLRGIGAPPEALDEVVVRQPSFVEGVARLWEDRPLEQWRVWLTLRSISKSAPFLPQAVVDENFAFYGRTLSGIPQLKERWRRGVALVEEVLGEAVGKLYVERHFPEAAKERMVTLVNNLLAAYRLSIESIDWMSADTRQRAVEKLDRFTPKIGYPDRWKDYSALDIRSDDLLGNILRANAWATDFDLAKLGQPVDRLEWFLTPQTVNAYYNPQMNEVVFPAAILQPPFFDIDADDAVNYGAIGAIIGHEIGHGFDDQGAQYDGAGNLNNWWQEADRDEFSRRADALIEQYNQLSPAGLPEHRVNGALTVGENIGDIGGLSIAIKAYETSLDGKEAPLLDGLTGVQRVLFGWAQAWRTKTRDAEAIRLLAIDPHSPADLRCNAVVANLDAFHEAFDVQEDDALFKPPSERVRIW